MLCAVAVCAALESLVGALSAAGKLAAGEQRSMIYAMAAKALCAFCKASPEAAAKLVLSGVRAPLPTPRPFP